MYFDEDCPFCKVAYYSAFVLLGFFLATVCWFLIPFLYQAICGLFIAIWVLVMWIKWVI